MISKHFTVELSAVTEKFVCGNKYLDKFIKSHEALDESIGKTYVFLTEDHKELIGYYNIATGSLQSVERVTNNPLKIKIGGTIHINAFAVSEDYQGKIIDEADILYADLLLDDCIQRIIKLRNDVGFEFVTLASTQEGLRLYNRFGFEYLEDHMTFAPEKDEFGCTPMYLSFDCEE